MTTRIYIDLPPKILQPDRDNQWSPGAPNYRAHLHTPDGEVIAEHTPTPFFDAARALLARGITGRLEMWDSQRPVPRLTGNIEAMAKLTVTETDEEGPRIARYVPFPGVRSGVRNPLKGSGGS